VLEKRSKNTGSPDRGAVQIYEICAFVPGTGFEALAYLAESGKQALQPFKREYQAEHTFRIIPARRKALSSPQAMHYLVWRKIKGHRFGQVNESAAALIGGQISIRRPREQMQILKDLEIGKFSQHSAADKALLNGS